MSGAGAGRKGTPSAMSLDVSSKGSRSRSTHKPHGSAAGHSKSGSSSSDSPQLTSNVHLLADSGLTMQLFL